MVINRFAFNEIPLSLGVQFFLKKVSSFLFFLSVVARLTAQTDSLQNSSPTPNKSRITFIAGTEAVLYAGSLVGLNELWYKNYPRSSFHFFNDNREWLQMDKVGHVTTAYYIGRIGIGFFKWGGMERKKAIWYGGMLGSVYQSTIEVLDGYSKEWGFSTGDFAANTAGSLMVIAQELLWDEQRVALKFGFQKSPYARYRPNLLGSQLNEQVLKDYNGQTYWISVNPSSFMKHASWFPSWLNVAAGYGADGMIGGYSNPAVTDEAGNVVSFERYRQFYLSLDIDLTRVKTRSVFLKSVFMAIGFIKIPAPALEFNRYGVKGRWLGF